MSAKFEINGNVLTITVDMTARGKPSKNLLETGSGKWLIASTSEKLGDFGNRTGIRVGLNVMCDAPSPVAAGNGKAATNVRTFNASQAAK